MPPPEACGRGRWCRSLTWLGLLPAALLGRVLLFPAGTAVSRWPAQPSYCSAPTSGSEGRPPRLAGRHGNFELFAVGIVIRHGDRSAIHSLPAAPATHAAPRWRCTPPAGHEAERLWPQLSSSFVVRSLRYNARLARSLEPLLAPDGVSCEPGQLTPRGFEQHLHIGRHLATRYGPLLDELAQLAAQPHVRGANSSSIVFARSTDYRRTLLSAAGLLLGLLGGTPSLAPTALRPLDLHTEEDELKDVMHGVGLASSSKGGGERVRRGNCPAAAEAAAAQLRTWLPDRGAWAKVVKMFGPGVSTTGVADATYARACHRMPPPCTEAGCVDAALAAQLWRDADRHYCERFAGADGGLRASSLSMLPLLKEVVSRLEAAARGDGPRLVLFSGHDTVIAPLLGALGAFSDPATCSWPPYASHLVFELWRPRGAGATHVRAVFNGEPITSRLGCCADVTVRGELCPLDRLADAVRELGAAFGAACPQPPQRED